MSSKGSLRWVWSRFAAFVALMATVTVAGAQGYPSRAITIVASFPPGSAVDTSARLLAPELARLLNQPVVVQNRTGAGGIVAATFVARAAPDGYTLFVGSLGTQVLNKGLYAKLPYDPEKDFIPVSRFFSVPNVLVVRSSLGVSTLAQLVQTARRQTDKPLTYGSAGPGTSSHLSGAQLAQLQNVNLLHVPFQATPAIITEMLGGRIDMVFGNISTLLPHVRSGAFKALAVTTRTRSPLLADVPTVAEVGIPQAEVSSWIGLFLPAGTPGAITARLNEAVRSATENPAYREAVEKSGSIVENDPSSESFARTIRDDETKWMPVLKATGIKAE